MRGNRIQKTGLKSLIVRGLNDWVQGAFSDFYHRSSKQPFIVKYLENLDSKYKGSPWAALKSLSWFTFLT